MGDLIHALPALSDARQAYPDIQFDWVIDESFAEVAGWHPAVNKVITSAHRRWKRNIGQVLSQGELKQFYQDLHAQDYDYIFDAQNNIKSAVITRLASSKATGLDADSAREWPAHWAYQQHIKVNKHQHAVNRMRQLFAQALNYNCPDSRANYGIDRQTLASVAFELPKRYLVFVHLASWPTKLWPQQHWQKLITLANDDGYEVLLPSGSQDEYTRSQQLAEANHQVHALAPMALSQVATILLNSQGAVCCDTGLAHMAAALDVPALTLYGPTDTHLIGTYGLNQKHIASKDFTCMPCYKQTCIHSKQAADQAQCLYQLSPELVWHNFKP